MKQRAGLGEVSLAGLRLAEADAAAAYQGLLDADEREVRRLERIALLKTEQARRKALRAERRDLPPGTFVTVADAPMLAGLTGEIVTSSGTDAVVSFGGSLLMTIEA